MSLTCGLNQEGAYILGNNVYVNTLKTFPSVIENKTYLITRDDGMVNTKAMIPIISENVNEKNLDDFKNFLVNNKVTEIPTLTEPFIAEISYNLVDDRGIILNSTAKINNVGLINCAILSDIDENNSMTYKLGRYFNISGIIDLPKDKSLSIRYEKANKVLQLNITSLTIYGTLSEKPYTFDKDVADTYFKYILSLEERERNRLLNKYKKESSWNEFRRPYDYHPTGSIYAKPISPFPEKIKESIIKPIFTSNILYTVFPKGLTYEFTNNFSSAKIDLEVIFDTVQVTDETEIMDIVLNNKKVLDNVQDEDPKDPENPSGGIPTPIPGEKPENPDEDPKDPENPSGGTEEPPTNNPDDNKEPSEGENPKEPDNTEEQPPVTTDKPSQEQPPTDNTEDSVQEQPQTGGKNQNTDNNQSSESGEPVTEDTSV